MLKTVRHDVGGQAGPCAAISPSSELGRSLVCLTKPPSSAWDSLRKFFPTDTWTEHPDCVLGHGPLQSAFPPADQGRWDNKYVKEAGLLPGQFSISKGLYCYS